MAHLKAIGGRFHGRSYEIDKVIIIGRGINADIQVLMPGVSRSHCKIYSEGQKFFVDDLGSKNGTRVNANPIKKHELQPGDLLEVAKARYKFNNPVGLKITSAKGAHELNLMNLGENETGSGSLSLIGGATSNIFKYDHIENFTKDDLLQKLNIVTSIAQDISSSLSLDHLMIKLMDKILEINPNSDSCTIVLRDQDGEYRPHHMRYSSEEKIPYHDLFVYDTLKSPHGLVKNIAVRMNGQSNKQSIMIAPIIYLKDTLGLIQLQSKLNSSIYIKEDLTMLRAISAQAASAIATAKMHDEILQQQRVQQDLEIAQRVQLNFLPNGSPNVKGFDLAATYTPAMHVAGDFYNYINKKDEVFVTIGDVSGKGVPAALVMAKLTSEIKFLCITKAKPSLVFSIVNNIFDKECSDDFFATALLLKVDIKSGEVNFVNAGHHPPIILRQDSSIEEIEGGNPPLGVMPNTTYDQIKCYLEPGDFMILFTDGLTEAMNKQKKEFGLDRLKKALSTRAVNSKQLNNTILKTIQKYTNGARQKDDMTLVTIHRDLTEVQITETPIPGNESALNVDTDFINLEQAGQFFDFLDDNEKK